MEGPESLHPYGTALPSLDEDTLFKEKPTRVEDQIVTDENGKRRFHGAFTGGFSAGYWNTVGSQEGWTPQSFKSSRAEKAMKLQQKPTDFMDDEDLGEFGFAPQRLQVREEYGGADSAGTSNEIRKRKLQLPSSFGGGESDVLNNIFLPVKTTVGVKILKSMGWRQGQGIGPRQTKKEKKQAAAFNKREMYVLQNYGCATTGKTDEVDNDSVIDVKGSTDEDESDEEITFAPDDYDAYDTYLYKPKENYFGLGYAGLSRTSILSDAKEMPAQHINLFGPLEVMGKNNKKLSITGQGFGVGALEEEDDDIYQREDMTKYDFSLDDKSGKKNKRKTKTETSIQDSFILEGFIAETNNAINAEQVFDVELTRDWKPRNWAERKSRFAPLNEKQLHALEKRRKQLTKPALTPKDRSQILEPPDTKTAPEQEKINLEKIKEKYTKRENKTKELLERISAKSSGFVLGGIIAMDGTEQNNKEVTKSSQDVAAKESGLFQPFVYDEAKQKRYDDFIAANPKTDQDITEFLSTIQPLHLSEWDREMEKQEFIQAKKLYKPLEGLMANRFVSETTVQAEITTKEVKKLEERTAVIVVRTKTVWKPASLLCKRYNIADPFGGIVGGDEKQQKHKNSKLSVFDYLEGSVNTKSNFITPVVIPKHMDNAKQIIKTAIESKNQNFTNTKNSVEMNEPSTSAVAAVAESNAINNDVIESDASRRLTFVPKTELEKRVVETRDLPIEEKRDIFKSIFADSDDDDDDVDIPEVEGIANSKTHEEEKQAIGQLEMNKTAASINLLRNTSPPRGIFAALFKTNTNETNDDKSIAKGNGEGDDYEPPPKIKFISKGQRHEDGNVLNVDGPKETLCENVYGPAIPTNLLISQSSVNTHSDTHAKVDQTADKRISYKGVEIVEQWVEKRHESSMDTTDDSSSSSTISSKKKHKKNKKSKKSKKSYDKKSKKSKKKKVKKEKEKHKSSKSKKR